MHKDFTMLEARAEPANAELPRGHDLLPTQARMLADLNRLVVASPITLVSGKSSVGVTTILEHFARQHDVPFVDRGALLTSWAQAPLGGADLAFASHILQLLDSYDLVVIDEMSEPGPSERDGSRELILSHLVNYVRDNGKRIVAGSKHGAGHNSWPYVGNSPDRARRLVLADLVTDDLRVWLERSYGKAAVASVDFGKIERLFGGLHCYDLQRLCVMIGDVAELTTNMLVSVLEQLRGTANVVIGEVEALSFDDLPGTAHIAEQLETHVLLPLERPDLARELDIRPKRGVLLYGPPGSGKTSIGRALAHRMGGRFFLIDGSIPTDPPGSFFGAVMAIVEQAKRHAPSVLFIDDADMLFGLVNITGVARYLLTLLDGMESEEAGKVCIMMTAMNVNKVPAPILRSGRVELWLPTNAPDLDARAAILKRWTGEDLPGHAEVDYAAIAAGIDNCTPADLRRIVGDARTEFAADSWAGRPPRSAAEYLNTAADDLVAARARMARHLNDDSLRIGTMREAALTQMAR